MGFVKLKDVAARLDCVLTGDGDREITGVVGILIFPWKLISTPEFYIFTWLGVVGGLLGTVAGILIADYWIVRRTVLHLADLYTPGGRYWYTNGWKRWWVRRSHRVMCAGASASAFAAFKPAKPNETPMDS